MRQALEGVEFVIHLAAYQDYMPDFSSFIHTNTESSALIFEIAVSDPSALPAAEGGVRLLAVGLRRGALRMYKMRGRRRRSDHRRAIGFAGSRV